MSIFTRKHAQVQYASNQQIRLATLKLFAKVRDEHVEINGKSYGLVAEYPETQGVYTAYVQGWVNGKRSKI